MLSDEYTQADFINEVVAFVNSRFFGQLEHVLLEQYKNDLIKIPSSDYTALVSQKRKIEALNDLIGTMRSLNTDQTLEEVNANNRKQFA
jgi:hypothetical protein